MAYATVYKTPSLKDFSNSSNLKIKTGFKSFSEFKSSFSQRKSYQIYHSKDGVLGFRRYKGSWMWWANLDFEKEKAFIVQQGFQTYGFRRRKDAAHYAAACFPKVDLSVISICQAQMYINPEGIIIAQRAKGQKSWSAIQSNCVFVDQAGKDVETSSCPKMIKALWDNCKKL